MRQHNQNTAILIFAYSEALESRSKSLSKRKTGTSNQLICKTLINKTFGTAAESQIPYYVIDEKLQEGTNFGDRLSNAFQSIFNRGYENVICIGNDCPSLTVNDLIKAKSYLESGSNVLGPDKRGGAYLIGLNRLSFNASQLSSLCWQSTDTWNSLTSYVDQYRYHVLISKWDINSHFDLDGFIQSLPKIKISRLLKEILGLNVINDLGINNKFISSFSTVVNLLRGPPVYYSH